LKLAEFTAVRGTANLSANLTANFFKKGGEQRTIPRNRLPPQGLRKFAIFPARKNSE